LCLRKGVEIFLAIKAMDINKKAPNKMGAISKAINPIAGELLSSRAHFLFRFMTQR
jgi:hypothetical protein